MSAYNLFSQPMSFFCQYSMCFIVFILRPVTTSFNQFQQVFCGSGPRFLKFSETGLVHGPSKKGNRTKTGPDFKALPPISSPKVFVPTPQSHHTTSPPTPAPPIPLPSESPIVLQSSNSITSSFFLFFLDCPSVFLHLHFALMHMLQAVPLLSPKVRRKKKIIEKRFNLPSPNTILCLP